MTQISPNLLINVNKRWIDCLLVFLRNISIRKQELLIDVLNYPIVILAVSSFTCAGARLTTSWRMLSASWPRPRRRRRMPGSWRRTVQLGSVWPSTGGLVRRLVEFFFFITRSILILLKSSKKQRSSGKVFYFINKMSFRVKNLMNPGKKWKLEKNAQQLYMTGTVVLYQVAQSPQKWHFSPKNPISVLDNPALFIFGITKRPDIRHNMHRGL